MPSGNKGGAKKGACPRARPPKDWKPTFLKTLGKTGTVASACKAAKVSRKTAYAHRNRSVEFRAEWDVVLENAIDAAEQEVRRRAITGVLKPVFQGGAQVGTIREFSDTLLIFYLKARRPEVFRDLSEKKLAELLAEKLAPQVVQAHAVNAQPGPAALGYDRPDGAGGDSESGATDPAGD